MQKQAAEFAALGIKVVGASVDAEDKTREMAASNGITFAMAHGVTRADADRIGAWWDGNRNFIQPSEFIVGADGKVVSATYSSGPIGRVDAADIVQMVKFLEARRAKA